MDGLKVIANAMHGTGAGKSGLKQLREATGQVVGSVFYATLLKTMRSSKLVGKYGHGGRGEEVFAAQLHGIFAERMGQAQSSGVGDALFRRLEHQQRLMDQQVRKDPAKVMEEKS